MKNHHCITRRQFVSLGTAALAMSAIGPARAADEKLASHWHAAGLEPRPLGGVYDHLYLDIYPPSLDPGYTYVIATQHLSRPETIAEPYDGELRDWFERPDDRPLVYVTFGTVFNDVDAGFHAVGLPDGLDG